jgi:hypothetical protein
MVLDTKIVLSFYASGVSPIRRISPAVKHSHVNPIRPISPAVKHSIQVLC